MVSTVLETLIRNACNLGKESQHVALAARVVADLPVDSLCVWCLEREDPQGAREVHRLPKGGECMHCAYSGYDCLVVM
jgi:hypothetical protein